MPAVTPRASVPGLARLVSLATAALVVAILWVGQTVLMPLAFGMVLAFLLTPVVRWFERLHFPRALAVAGTMVMALALVGAFAWTIGVQVGALSSEVGEYATSLQRKLADIRRHPNGTIDALEQTVATVSAELDDSGVDIEHAPPVRVVTDELSGFATMRDTLEPVLTPLAAMLMVLVLVSFMLGRREDVRDRIIRLLGPDNVTSTTRLIDDAFQAVSRYLLAQTLMNATVGLLVTLGLWWIGVPYAALWGGLTAVLRFVPYLGILVALALPATVAFATTPGWNETIATVGVFAVLDVAFAYFVEPMVIGRQGGVSSLALLISAVFWTWIWGPIGLAVATPLTLCIAVLGRQLPELEVLGVLLGDAPALSSELSYYQRLLARDAEEARAIVLRERVSLGDVRLMDELLIPALCWSLRDLERGEILEEDAKFVAETTASILGGLEPTAPVAGASPRWIAIAARPCGEPLLQMLRVCGASAELPSSSLLAAELLEELVRDPPAMVCVAALSSTASTHARRLCRRIRARLPEVELVVLRPAADRRAIDSTDSAFERRALESGADTVVGTIAEALACANEQRPPAIPLAASG
jgi:predicted PurR-regulated permease PerM